MKDDPKAARSNLLLIWLREQNKKERRGVLARLRCGLRPATERRAWPWLWRRAGGERRLSWCTVSSRRYRCARSMPRAL